MPNRKAKFKVQDLFFHKEQGIWLFVDAIEFIKQKDKFLYTLRVLLPHENRMDNDEWKKYYEDKLVEQCGLVAKRDTAEALYGQRI